MKAALKRLVPAAWLERWRAARRQLSKLSNDRDNKRRIAARRRSRTLDAGDLARLLEDVGVKPGSCVFVHSGISRFNRVEGGASGILDALSSAVGGSGNLMFPAFAPWLRTVSNATPFDAASTRSSMGELAEAFRRSPGVVRSLHPTHSVCARGPAADWLVRGHESSPYPFGRGTPFFKACSMDATLVAIGVDLNSVTSFHIYEDLLADVIEWLPIYLAGPMEFSITDAEGRATSYRGFVHNIEMARNRDCERLRNALLDSGSMKVVRTDMSGLLGISVRGLVRTCLRELLAGRTIYGPHRLPAADREKVAQLLAALERPDGFGAVA
jgi:aminoglycoside 3-N-acetyltransferase